MSASPLQPDPYELLGVAIDADLDTIKKAHRKLVLKNHPDRIKDPALAEHGKIEFQWVQLAYEMLVDPARRQSYDAEVRLAQLRKERTLGEGRSGDNTTTYTAQTVPRPAPRESVQREQKSKFQYAHERRAPSIPYFEDSESFPETWRRKSNSYERKSSAPKPVTDENRIEKGGLWDGVKPCPEQVSALRSVKVAAALKAIEEGLARLRDEAERTRRRQMYAEVDTASGTISSDTVSRRRRSPHRRLGRRATPESTRSRRQPSPQFTYLSIHEPRPQSVRAQTSPSLPKSEKQKSSANHGRRGSSPQRKRQTLSSSLANEVERSSVREQRPPPRRRQHISSGSSDEDDKWTPSFRQGRSVRRPSPAREEYRRRDSSVMSRLSSANRSLRDGRRGSFDAEDRRANFSRRRAGSASSYEIRRDSSTLPPKPPQQRPSRSSSGYRTESGSPLPSRHRYRYYNDDGPPENQPRAPGRDSSPSRIRAFFVSRADISRERPVRTTNLTNSTTNRWVNLSVRKCYICNGYVWMRRKRDWQSHVLKDIQPYQCFEVECSSTTTYSQLSHLVAHYRTQHKSADVMLPAACECIFCEDRLPSSIPLRFKHIGKHLTDHAFSIIPRQQEDWQFYSDSTSVSEGIRVTYPRESTTVSKAERSPQPSLSPTSETRDQNRQSATPTEPSSKRPPIPKQESWLSIRTEQPSRLDPSLEQTTQVSPTCYNEGSFHSSQIEAPDGQRRLIPEGFVSCKTSSQPSPSIPLSTPKESSKPPERSSKSFHRPSPAKTLNKSIPKKVPANQKYSSSRNLW